MLIMIAKTTKHFQHIPLSAHHLDSDINYRQWPCLKKIGNYQQTFNVITKNNDEKTTLTLESLDFIH